MSIIIDTNNITTNTAIKVWGPKNQIEILQEECGELVSALSRLKRKRTGTAPVSEEIADVIVSMMSVIPALGVEAEVSYFIKNKVDRLETRINEVKNDNTCEK